MSQDIGPEDGSAVEQPTEPAGEQPDDRRKRSTVWALLAIAILMLVVFWLIWQYLGRVGTGPEVQPKVTSSEIPVALPGNGVYEPEDSESATASIEETRPTVPDVVGMNRSDAITAIRAAGYFASVMDVYGTTHPSNTVIQQNPTGGAALDQGEEVGLLVQVQPAAKPRVVVPELTGLSQTEAERKISALGSTAVISYRPVSSDPGRVFSQWPLAGASIDKGSDIQIQVTVKP